MDETLKLGKDSATGGLHLFFGKTLSTVILAVGTIVLGWFILEGDYGLYAIALIPAATLLLFQDWGVGQAMTRYCAQCRATNNEGTLRKIIVAGLTFEVASGNNSDCSFCTVVQLHSLKCFRQARISAY